MLLSKDITGRIDFLRRNFQLSPALRALSAKPLVPPAPLRCAGGYTLDARFAGSDGPRLFKRHAESVPRGARPCALPELAPDQ
jgi:hypothetical protein